LYKLPVKEEKNIKANNGANLGIRSSKNNSLINKAICATGKSYELEDDCSEIKKKPPIDLIRCLG
jgi:hypothetical protein